MLQALRNSIKSVYDWYDTQPTASRFWPWASTMMLGLFMVASDTTIVSILGTVYFICLFATRWAHVNGKL
jgi:hypothetical protein